MQHEVNYIVGTAPVIRDKQNPQGRQDTFVAPGSPECPRGVPQGLERHSVEPPLPIQPQLAVATRRFARASCYLRGSA